MMNFFKYKTGTFNHGIHPPEMKDDTKGLPIRQFPFPPMIVLPLAQHIGAPSEPVVKEGDVVARGQLVAKANGYMSVPLHAPVSGKVKKIDYVPTISGKKTMGIYIETFPSSNQEVIERRAIDLTNATPAEILTGIQHAGIVGLGGAAFPTHVKLSIPEGKTCKYLIINGVECEPYLTTDHRVMLEQQEDIFMGLRYLIKALSPQKVYIGIEANKRDAFEKLEQYKPLDLAVEMVLLPVKYPQGAEKMLVTAITGLEVPSGKLPIEVGAVVINVATTAEIGRLLPHGRGIQERVITITGPGIAKKGNYLITIGTPLRFILDQVGAEDIKEVFMGGPMMGVSVSNLDIPITKGTSGIVAFKPQQTLENQAEYACIRCGACLDACPLSLNPSQLGILAKNESYDLMASEHHLLDCFECGSCSYVCPSNIPLVQYFRVSKSIVRKRQAKAKS